MLFLNIINISFVKNNNKKTTLFSFFFSFIVLNN